MRRSCSPALLAPTTAVNSSVNVATADFLTM
eukprot:CAMPEP_0119109766 /NCGR_PEP_ID=MMETSP1180-20130426/23096_1 /TAXON_ID=3052 ORGANISM="Chlamydomonas cf sp, Strain CCMP681" /NCGR_SAMPLE_ID=MMETSP1180 /ASSEMBLY_ACC=CAM_ASM_000741 /LENGTH=30 /DNA_ID= /DNA_START= /DNA_END= /DNA_ORIENTATION=